MNGQRWRHVVPELAIGAAAALLAAACTLTAAETGTMTRQPEEQNALVSFGETPGAPQAPDVGVAMSVNPAVAPPGQPIHLLGAFSADGKLITACGSNLAACISLTLIRIDKPSRVTMPLIRPTVEVKAPPGGNYGARYREGGQFRLDLRAFFDLPLQPGVYSIEARMGTYTSGVHGFRIGVP
jgi:hypothetical protein